MCRLRNIALESVTEKCDRRTDRQTDRQTTDKVIPMCRYALQATQKIRVGRSAFLFLLFFINVLEIMLN